MIGEKMFGPGVKIAESPLPEDLSEGVLAKTGEGLVSFLLEQARNDSFPDRLCALELPACTKLVSSTVRWLTSSTNANGEVGLALAILAT